jgi:hypothetical protein
MGAVTAARPPVLASIANIPNKTINLFIEVEVLTAAPLKVPIATPTSLQSGL